MRRPWLAPLVPVYAAGWLLRAMALQHGWVRRQRLRWPVISVGSVSAGGAGKTPLTIALARLLVAHGMAVDVLSRGYGRKSRETLLVDASGDAETFGDEPLLIARESGVPVLVATQRWKAGDIAEQQAVSGCAVHLLDDGFQHRQLHRALDIAMVSAEDLCDHLLPAGNLREPLRALQRADALLVRDDDEQMLTWLARQKIRQTIWRYHRQMQWPTAMPRKVFAFCGIARPEAFLRGLRAGGVEIAGERVLRDHQTYAEQDVARLCKELQQCGAHAFVTTTKDLARLGNRADALRQVAPVFCAEVILQFADAVAVVERIRTVCAEARGQV